jgi:hypothetical protein
LAEILNAYRISMGNPATGPMFHSGDCNPMDLDKLAQQVIRPLVKRIGLEWYGWHGFSGVALRRICMSWVQTRKSFNASCAMQNRT